MYKTLLSREAAKYYQKVDKSTRKRLDRALNTIENNPFDTQKYDIKALHAPLKGLWRFRVGKLRIIYRVVKKSRQILIITIRPRGDVY